MPEEEQFLDEINIDYQSGYNVVKIGSLIKISSIERSQEMITIPITAMRIFTDGLNRIINNPLLGY